MSATATPAPSEIALPGDEPVSHAARRAESLVALGPEPYSLRNLLSDLRMARECVAWRGSTPHLRDAARRRINKIIHRIIEAGDRDRALSRGANLDEVAS